MYKHSGNSSATLSSLCVKMFHNICEVNDFSFLFCHLNDFAWNATAENPKGKGQGITSVAEFEYFCNGF